MNKIILLLAALIPIVALALEPASISITNLRDEAVSAANSNVYYRSETINFTNCVCYSGTTTSSDRENLTGVTVLLSLGDGSASSQTVTGTVQNATSGVWNASVTLRATEGAKTYIQLRLTNSAATYTYPLKYIDVKSKL